MTFNDLNFHPREVGGIQAVVFFENGYGASVIKGWGSYGNEEGLYELAVIKGVSGEWDLCYDTNLTEDVLGYLSEDQVTGYLELIEAL